MPSQSLQYTEGTSNKFWNIERKGNALTVHFGEIGTAGQTKTIQFGAEAAAEQQFDKLVREKLEKGYVESSGGTGGASIEPESGPPAKKIEARAAVKLISPKTLRKAASLVAEEDADIPDFAALADDERIEQFSACVLDSPAGIQADWKIGLPAILLQIGNVTENLGVSLSSDDDGERVVKTITFVAKDKSLSFKIGNEPDDDLYSWVFAIDKILPESVVIYALNYYLSSDMYALAVLSDKQVKSLRNLLGTAFDGFFNKAETKRKLRAAASKARQPKKTKWSKSFEWGKRTEPSDFGDEEQLLTLWRAIELFDFERPIVTFSTKIPPDDPYISRIASAYREILRIDDTKLDGKVKSVSPSASWWLSGLSGLSIELSGKPLDPWLLHGDAARLPTLFFMQGFGALLGTIFDLHGMKSQLAGEEYSRHTIGSGNLIWGYFAFRAMGCTTLAKATGRTLLLPQLREEERYEMFARKEAFYDLAAWMHSGERGNALQKLGPMLPLAERGGWENAEAVEAAVVCHAEKRGEQFTHDPEWYCWPAELYALARHAGANELLPQDNPFLNLPLDFSQVDKKHPIVAGMLGMEERVLAMAAKWV